MQLSSLMAAVSAAMAQTFYRRSRAHSEQLMPLREVAPQRSNPVRNAQRRLCKTMGRRQYIKFRKQSRTVI